MAEKTITVRRKNVFLDIAPEQVEKYKAKGYDVVDKFGNVLEKSNPDDPKALKQAYDEQIIEIKKLKAKIRELEAELKTTLQALPSAKPEEEEVVVEVKPKTSGKKSKK